MSLLPDVLREPPVSAAHPQPRRVLGFVRSAGLGVLGGFAVGAAFAWGTEGHPILGRDSPLWLRLPLFLLLFQLTLWVSVLVHELGHMGTAMLCGWRPFILSVGPVRVQFGASFSQCQWRRNPSGLGIAGFSANLPPATGTPMSVPGFGWMLAGGPIASLVLAGLAAGFWVSEPGLGLAEPSLLLACVSGLMGLVNWLPLRTAGFVSDGGQLLELWRGDPAVQERLDLALLQAQALSGRRPRDWDEALLARVAAAHSEPSAQRLGPLLQAMHAQDRGDSETAHRHFVAYAQGLHGDGLASIPRPFQAALQLPVATYLAQELGEAGAAERWLDAALAHKASIVQPFDLLQAKAAVAWANGHAETAHKLAHDALEAQKAAGLEPSAFAFQREALQRLLS